MRPANSVWRPAMTSRSSSVSLPHCVWALPRYSFHLPSIISQFIAFLLWLNNNKTSSPADLFHASASTRHHDRWGRSLGFYADMKFILGCYNPANSRISWIANEHQWVDRLAFSIDHVGGCIEVGDRGPEHRLAVLDGFVSHRRNRQFPAIDIPITAADKHHDRSDMFH